MKTDTFFVEGLKVLRPVTIFLFLLLSCTLLRRIKPSIIQLRFIFNLEKVIYLTIYNTVIFVCSFGQKCSLYREGSKPF